MMAHTRGRRGRKVQEMSTRIKSSYCQSGKQSDKQAILASWNLSELQRDFIESVFENNSK